MSAYLDLPRRSEREVWLERLAAEEARQCRLCDGRRWVSRRINLVSAGMFPCPICTPEEARDE